MWDSMAPGSRAARFARSTLAGMAGLVALTLAGCSAAPTTLTDVPAARSRTTAGATPTSGPSQPVRSPSAPQRSTRAAPADAGRPNRGADRPSQAGRIQRAELSIPAMGIRNLRVVPYRGSTDDAAGTTIQDKGRAASPYGPDGGTGPGGIGNYQVTAHRTSSTAAFGRLPTLGRGDLVTVRTARTVYVYRIITTRRTSFRSAASLRAQRAAVPGHPGERPTRAMITLSTCATLEDHAAGNYWADKLGNPQHRIDKIGVLISARARH